MWIIEPNEWRAKLDLSKIRSDFKQVTDNGLTLVCPKRNVWDWSVEERFLRSVVVDQDGFVVSCGWPKFGNYGEFEDDTESLQEALESGGDVRFSHKEDGSLCIRSVINGQVVMRTRGTLYGGERGEDGTESFRERFFRTAQNRYPILLDSRWMDDRSLLFEYVSPGNLVVVQYKKEDLVFLGFVDHGLHLGHWHELVNVSREGSLNLVRLHDLPHDPIEILEAVKTWKDEGIVARCFQDQVMVKVKSAHYLAQHRMKFSINYRFMVEFVDLSGIKNEAGLVKELRDCDYDFEVIETVLPFYHRYQKAVAYADGLVDEAKQIVDSFRSDETDEAAKRKELAMSISKKKGPVKPFVFSLYDGKLDRVKTLHKKIVMNEGKK